jgi:hypothetical protein
MREFLLQFSFAVRNACRRHTNGAARPGIGSPARPAASCAAARIQMLATRIACGNEIVLSRVAHTSAARRVGKSLPSGRTSCRG